MKLEIDNGLIVDKSASPPTCCGYIFNFAGHGAFAPDGKVTLADGRELTQSEIDTHNRLLAEAEFAAILKHGQGVLYLSKPAPETYEAKAGHFKVSTWCSTGKPVYTYHERKSRNDFGTQRTDVWFMLDGSRWHGVNIGDNDIVRVKRCKS